MTHLKLVESMLNPGFYPHNPDSVDLIQTHISFIFIAGGLVYKVKKAVDFGFLNFTTLEKRKYYCDEELRLNKRLAGEVYIDVVAISEDEKGNLCIDGDGEVIEYAVRMKKIPEERMLYRLLSENAVERSVMDGIAKKIFNFHENAATGKNIDNLGGYDTILHNHNENFEQIADYINVTIPENRYSFIKSYALDFIRKNEPLLRKRIAEHKIRDCHGDLHLQHICITDDILIFDCIEFNERFRYLDVAAEIAFLSMDLDYNGYCDNAKSFVDSYLKYSSDAEIEALLNFYKCYFACVRGKVIGFKINDKTVGDEERTNAAKTASYYFDLAYGYATRLEKPTLILVSGLMGTGKSVLAKNISSHLGAKIVRSDEVRKEILDIPKTERHYEDFGEGIYSTDVTMKTYDKTFEMAEDILKDGGSVIIDASFKDREQRVKTASMASSLGADFFVIECVCPDEILKGRLSQRMQDKEEVSDGRWEILEAQKKSFEKIDEFEERTHIVVDASFSPEECSGYAIGRIRL